MAGNPPSHSSPITFQNWGSGQAPDLYGHMGFGESTWRGDQPGQSILGQRLAPIMGSRVQNQLLFGNQLEGQRQAAIMNMLRNMQSGNVYANAERIRAKGMRGAMANAAQTQFALRKMGLGSGAQAGAVQAGFNQANSVANQHLANMMSPEGQHQMLQSILGAIGQGQQSNLAEFMAINSSMDQREMIRKQGLGGGSVFNGVAPFLGMAAQAFIPNLFARPGGGGGGGLDLSQYLAGNGNGGFGNSQIGGGNYNIFTGGNGGFGGSGFGGYSPGLR